MNGCMNGFSWLSHHLQGECQNCSMLSLSLFCCQWMKFLIYTKLLLWWWSFFPAFITAWNHFIFQYHHITIMIFRIPWTLSLRIWVLNINGVSNFKLSYLSQSQPPSIDTWLLESSKGFGTGDGDCASLRHSLQIRFGSVGSESEKCRHTCEIDICPDLLSYGEITHIAPS